MDDLFLWAIHKRLLSECGLRVYLYFQFLQRINKHPEKIISFSRNRISKKTGLSVNSVKKGIRELEKFKMILIDPFSKGNRNILILLPKDKFNWGIISEVIKSEKSKRDDRSGDDGKMAQQPQKSSAG